MDLSTIEQKLDDSKYKSLNEVSIVLMSTCIKNNMEFVISFIISHK